MTCQVCPVPCGVATEQPLGSVSEADGVTVVTMVVPLAQTIVPQHAHAYDHLTLVGYGALDAWAGQNFLGRFRAGQTLCIKAHIKHSFLTLVDGTTAYCIHRTDRTGAIEIAALHDLVGV